MAGPCFCKTKQNFTQRKIWESTHCVLRVDYKERGVEKAGM